MEREGFCNATFLNGTENILWQIYYTLENPEERVGLKVAAFQSTKYSPLHLHRDLINKRGIPVLGGINYFYTYLYHEQQ